MEEKQGLPIRAVTSAQEWESWLADQHGAARGVWLKLAKKRTGIDTVSYAEAVEAALCYGWIDGQGRRTTTPTGCRSSLRAAREACGRSSTASKRWS